MASASSFGLSVGSDDIRICDVLPCLGGSVDLEAEKYCVECEKYMCGVCLKSHNQWAANATHKIVESHDGFKFLKRVLRTKCDQHRLDYIDTFCVNHDVVCCSQCATKEHGLCNKMPVLESCRGIKASYGFRNFSKSLNDAITDIQQFEKHLQREQGRLVGEIKQSKMDIDKHFDKVEQVSTNLVSKAYSGIETTTKDKRTLLLQMKGCLDDQQNDFEPDLFINFKKGKKLVTECNQFLGDMKGSTPFAVDNEMFPQIEKIKSFGRITRMKRRYEVEMKEEYNLRVSGDNNDCDITGSCMLTDGTVLVVDRANHKLKMLNKLYRVDKTLTILGKPYGVCEVAESRTVAVTILEKMIVQFVTVGGQNMQCATSFPVSDKCRGISFKDPELYVSCGGSYGEGPGHISVYDIFGALFRKIDTKSIKIPIHIAFVPSTNSDFDLYVTDSAIGAVVHMNKHGQYLGKFSDSMIREAKGLCLINYKQFLMSGKRSNNVVLFDNIEPTPKQPYELLQNAYGAGRIEKPTSLLYDEKTSTLLVLMAGNSMKMFQLS